MKGFLRKFSTRFFLIYLPLAVLCFYILFPILWTIGTSLKPEKEIFPLRYLPEHPTLEHYIKVFTDPRFLRFFLNSITVSLSTALGAILVTVLSGYSIARFKFRGKMTIIMLILGTQMFPAALLAIPLYTIMMKLSLLNSLIGLMIVYVTLQIPFCTVMMRGFFAAVPVELEEAAMIDGCSRVGALFKVSLPLVLPGMVATGIFAFIGSWNELMLAVTLLEDVDKMTFPPGLSQFIGETEILWGRMNAAAIVALLPAVILFAFIQRYLVQGLSSGAVKG
jgi:multiple sugar transport system permease protein